MAQKLVNFKADEDEHKAWKDAAWAEQVSFSQWARDACNEKLAPPVDQVIHSIKSFDKKIKAKAVTMSGSCENRLPKGSFCKQCGRLH